MNKKISLKVCPTSKLAVSRLRSQEINALAAKRQRDCPFEEHEGKMLQMIKKKTEKTDKKLCFGEVLTAVKFRQQL